MAGVPTGFQIGYWLSCEEHPPGDLVRNAVRAEHVGFRTAMISDHFHPWVGVQGQSPFVWGVLGAIAGATTELRVGTGVTCPIMRIHPAIVAQAAATTACLMPGRFFLGVGSGERLNEHIVGYEWPPPRVRLQMLEEAVTIIRKLWHGGTKSLRGRYFTLDRAQIFSRPAEPPPIYVAAGAPRTARAAARFGDGLISVTTSSEVVKAFDEGGGANKPRIAQIKVCWAESEKKARQVAHKWWPVAARKGASSELCTPREFEKLTKDVTEDEVARGVVCGPDAAGYHRRIRQFAEAGYDVVYLHQVGPDQEGFLRFSERELLTRYGAPQAIGHAHDAKMPGQT